MADLSGFLDESDDDDSEVDINDNQIIPDIVNQDDNIDTKMAVNKQVSEMNIDNNTDTIVRAEDLFAIQAQKEKEQNQELPSAIIDHQTTLNFDLGHLCCYDPVSINIDELFKHRKDCKPNPKKNANNVYQTRSNTISNTKIKRKIFI